VLILLKRYVFHKAGQPSFHNATLADFPQVQVNVQAANPTGCHKQMGNYWKNIKSELEGGSSGKCEIQWDSGS
jgi:hypothetical protein